MRHGDNADGAQLRAAARGFLSRTATEAETRSLMATDAGYDEALWKRMASELKLASLSFEDTQARLVGTSGDGARVLSRVLDLAAVALASEQVGGASRCLDMAVEYAKTRVQFDRPIGSFQAVKHKCADMLVAVETARSALFGAIRHATAGDVGLPVSASIAKTLCSEAFLNVATENIHVHGGIGFTWEHPAHLYFRRAKSGEMLLGTPTYHRRRFARLWQLVP